MDWYGTFSARFILFIFAMSCLGLAFSHETRSQESAESKEERTGNAGKRLNVLLLIVDDMRAEVQTFFDLVRRPWLNRAILTPNLEALARQSLVLKQAYVQQTVCNPSRTSFLTSRRPDTTRVYDNSHTFREAGPDIVSMPQYFLQNGYRTKAVGKVFHTDVGVVDPRDEKHSWSEPAYIADAEYLRKIHEPNSWRSVSQNEQKNLPLEDQLYRTKALEVLEEMSADYKSKRKNFFLGVGFRKPHLPFVCPGQFYDKYNPGSCGEAANDYCPYKMAEEAWVDSGEILHYDDNKQYDAEWTINSTLPLEKSQELRRAYYSCVTYIDHLVGEVLQKLDELEMRDNTIVAFLGDHGWHLGENAIWGKTTLFEAAAHAPLMISIPGLTTSGLVSNELVEMVDLAPTLVEAAGLEKMATCPSKNSHKVPVCTEGSSLMPLITHPDTVQWKTHAFTQYPYPHNGPKYMGYSLRTKKYRYNEWVNINKGLGETRSNPKAVELYDIEADPRQNFNRADDPNYADIRRQLSDMLHDGWHAALPSTA